MLLGVEMDVLYGYKSFGKVGRECRGILNGFGLGCRWNEFVVKFLWGVLFL